MLEKGAIPMAIKSIKVLNVLAFQRQWRNENRDLKEKPLQAGDHLSDAFSLDFCDGINVLIGENGTGKTSLLKMIYAATQWSHRKTDIGKTDQLQKFFSNNLTDSTSLKSADRPNDYSEYIVSDGKHTFHSSLTLNGILGYEQWLGLDIPSIFIPTTEMLSHSKGFLALNQKYKMPFDGTQVDIIVNASLPEAREIPPYMQNILDKISTVIDGEIIQEDDTFYVLKKDGRKIDFSLEAEGLRKLGLIWKLIRNGLLEAGTILLWDEPEANLNPELFPLIAEILLELEKNGIQIFVATHSYNFAKYLEIRRTKREQVQFHNLYKGNSQAPDNITSVFSDSNHCDHIIYNVSAYTMEDLGFNHIMAADEKLLNEIYEM